MLVPIKGDTLWSYSWQFKSGRRITLTRVMGWPFFKVFEFHWDGKL